MLLNISQLQKLNGNRVQTYSFRYTESRSPALPPAEAALGPGCPRLWAAPCPGRQSTLDAQTPLPPLPHHRDRLGKQKAGLGSQSENQLT